MEKSKLHFKLLPWLLAFIVLLGLIRCSNLVKNNELRLFVAASLAPHIQKAFVNDSTNHITINAASSGMLAQQINAGATADVYFSANKRWMDYLCSKNHVKPQDVITLAQNKLVIIVPKKSKNTLNEKNWDKQLPSLKSIAIGNPDFVPVGEYAMQVLNNLGLASAFRSKLITVNDAPSAIRIIELGEADAAFVYKTDAMACNKAKTVAIVNDTLYQPICYYFAPLTVEGKNFINRKGVLHSLKSELTNKGFNTNGLNK